MLQTIRQPQDLSKQDTFLPKPTIQMRIQTLIYAEHNITFITNIITVVPVMFHVRLYKTISPKMSLLWTLARPGAFFPLSHHES